jgi:integrating conjugative element protein (TIGR03757 family)
VRIPCRGWTAFGVRLEPCSHSQDARHDGSLLETHPAAAGTRIACAGGLLLCLLGQDASAADVLVVTDSRHPVQSASGARVIELDLPERIEAELAAGLPADPGRAAALVQQRLRDGGQALQRRIGSAYQGVADAWGWARQGACRGGRSPLRGLRRARCRARRGAHRIPSEGTAMNRLLSASSRRARLAIASVLLGGAASSFALNTATIVSSALSPDCLEYRVVGICYWLFCTWTGCTVRTSVKVRHYIPDAVVSSYSNTGENPWIEVRAMSMPNPRRRPAATARRTTTTRTTSRSSRTPT